MSILTRQAYEIVYTGQDKSLQARFPKVVSSKSTADAEVRYLKSNDLFQVSAKDIHVIAIKRSFARQAPALRDLTLRYLAAFKEQVLNNYAAQGVIALGLLIIFASVSVSGVVFLLGGDAGESTELTFSGGIAVAFGLFGLFYGAAMNTEPRQDMLMEDALTK